MNVLVTGGAGFIGSHIAERWAQQGHDVVVLDNLSRARLLGKNQRNARHNWENLAAYPRIRRIEGDVRDESTLEEVVPQADLIFHAASQTAVTMSIQQPHLDFSNNVIGTFRVLEAARLGGNAPTIIFCSTNKVYGENVNRIGVKEGASCYSFEDAYRDGISESFSVDLCEHTPYGCSKLAGDLYMQEYARLYGLKVGVFRMSCIYGTRQFGFEDQGWLAWFTIATLSGQPITIYGDGKQVRDVLYISDLIDLYQAFIESDRSHGVYNAGGGKDNTLSLLQLLDLLEELTNKRSQLTFAAWRPSDQKVYISHIKKSRDELGWMPKVGVRQGTERLVEWVAENVELF